MTKKIKGFNHWGWGIAGVLTMIIVTGLVGAGILNSMANDPAFKNMTCTQCEPGMNPWVFQHPLMFLGILGCVALIVGLITLITFIVNLRHRKYVREMST